ncbi:hypothetical protein BGZ97_004750 [Linnemannia gamsii]|uniref:Uncharacterized protein n=1 Tax=Linnemannia gamsii TaxID=64522 RepID=A0A9P6RG28_9FUNG|nr:hypothetical protein BGZ97_004750 [Linnemannia gamsii]
MHPLTPNITRTEDQPSSTSTFATPLSQYPTRTLLSTARTPISSLSSTYLQTGSTLFTSQQPCQCDFETERQRHLKQNQDIIRLVALKSIQIRRSEADISQLERANMELTVALHRAKKEQQENSITNPALRHNIAYSPVITSLQEEWAQLGQTQQAIPHLQRQIDSGLPQHHQHTNHDIAEWRKFRTSDADIMLSLTPRSKRRKLEYLAVSSAIPRDLAMVKLEHIRTIYQHMVS